ncbi:MAG: hypothetical protein EXS00_00845 [Phycisphaerales bacterium]|nr:hypothetical protein [Phycisphaerales bacterium]
MNYSSQDSREGRGCALLVCAAILLPVSGAIAHFLGGGLLYLFPAAALCLFAIVLCIHSIRRLNRGCILVGLFMGCAVPIAACCLATGIVVSLVGTWAKYADAISPDFGTAMRGGVLLWRVESYRGIEGSLPTDLAQLDLEEGEIIDGWGTPFIYLVAPDTGKFTLRSFGPDRIDGTSDDILIEEFSSVAPRATSSP